MDCDPGCEIEQLSIVRRESGTSSSIVNSVWFFSWISEMDKFVKTGLLFFVGFGGFIGFISMLLMLIYTPKLIPIFIILSCKFLIHQYLDRYKSSVLSLSSDRNNCLVFWCPTINSSSLATWIDCTEHIDYNIHHPINFPGHIILRRFVVWRNRTHFWSDEKIFPQKLRIFIYSGDGSNDM